TKRTSPALICLRKTGLDWYGVRKRTAFASARAPSSDRPVEAPVSTPIWKGRPAACSAFALRASPRETALAAPAGVKPLKATVEPCSMRPAASSAVRKGNGRAIRLQLRLGGMVGGPRRGGATSKRYGKSTPAAWCSKGWRGDG